MMGEDVAVDDDRDPVLAEVIRSRRTSMVCDRDREVPAEVIDRLCELATWAPNHKRTWPWRFAAFSGDGRLRLGEACCQDLIDSGSTDEGKLAKVATKYARTPSVLVVGCAPMTIRPSMTRTATRSQPVSRTCCSARRPRASPRSGRPRRYSRSAHTRVVRLRTWGPDYRDDYLGWSTDAPAAAERPPVKVRHITR